MQKIYFGAPGTGKSYKIDTQVIAGVSDDCIFRVTFYPDFTYNDFIGQLLPKVIPAPSGGSSTITYDFQKGVFTRALEKAYENTSNDVYLIVEEMSRGDCAAIFGDIFQLLDREKAGVNKGYSRYFIDNELIAKDIVALPGSKVKLPPNFHILGTVNTSDQNVFVMDTAFKRRFEWEYVSPDPVVSSAPGITPITYENDVTLQIVDRTGTMRPIQWVELYQKLNKFIADDSFLGLGEDKQLGPFFLDFDVTAPYARHKTQVKNKLLHYLWSDVHKASFKNDVRLFDDSIGAFAELYSSFEADKKIFSDVFLATL